MYIFIFFPDTITNYHKFCDKDEERYILAQFWMSRVYDGCLELKLRTVFLLVGLGDNEVFPHRKPSEIDSALLGFLSFSHLPSQWYPKEPFSYGDTP